mmetsp:Transcript_8423/g.26016  ORF Transcript_8423/g.26016 Transcript_8423/m.26016 type:complete len:94 (+) Transcript_8423:2190-2471(+)
MRSPLVDARSGDVTSASSPPSAELVRALVAADTPPPACMRWSGRACALNRDDAIGCLRCHAPTPPSLCRALPAAARAARRGGNGAWETGQLRR